MTPPNKGYKKKEKGKKRSHIVKGENMATILNNMAFKIYKNREIFPFINLFT